MSMAMLDKALDTELRKITESERYHLENPGVLSPKYDSISRVIHRGKEVYYFDQLDLTERQFDITKNSRFTTVPEHTHANLHMSYIYSGECKMKADGKILLLEQNDVCFIDCDVVRSKEYLSENDIVISIHFSHSFLTTNVLNRLVNRSFFSNFIMSALSNNNKHDNYIFLRAGGNKKIRSLFLQLITECYNKNIFTNEIISSYLSLIMIELILLYRNNVSQHIINISREERDDILDIIGYIDVNFITCSLKDLSREFGYSEKYISQLIRNKTGMGFKEIQTMRRLNHAAHLLETSDAPIRTIAENSGIANENYFYKKFYLQYGKTPKEYRDEFTFLHVIEHRLL